MKKHFKNITPYGGMNNLSTPRDPPILDPEVTQEGDYQGRYGKIEKIRPQQYVSDATSMKTEDGSIRVLFSGSKLHVRGVSSGGLLGDASTGGLTSLHSGLDYAKKRKGKGIW